MPIHGPITKYIENCQEKFIELDRLFMTTGIWEDPDEPRCPTNVNDRGEEIPCISHPELTWIKDRIGHCMDGRKPTKKELIKANFLWNKYKNYEYVGAKNNR